MNKCPINFNPYDIQYADDMFDIYGALRDNEPVYWNDKEKFWIITRYDDLINNLKNYKIFSSQYGSTPPTRVPYGSEIDNKFFIERKDPPEHNIDRRILKKILNELIDKDFKSQIKLNIKEILKSVTGEIEVVSTIFQHYPIQAVSELLGIDTDAIKSLHRYTEKFFDLSDEKTQKESSIAIAKYLLQNQPTKLTYLKNMSVGDLVINEFEIMRFAIILIMAGYETVTNTLSNLIVDLSSNRDQFELLLKNKSLIPDAVEESLRLRRIAQQVMRTALTDIQIHDKTIKEGDVVVFLNGAANTDPRYIENSPDKFIVNRQRNPINLSFGYGPHYCPGAHFARIQLIFFLEEIVDNYSNFKIISKEKTKNNNLSGRYWEKIYVEFK